MRKNIKTAIFEIEAEELLEMLKVELNITSTCFLLKTDNADIKLMVMNENHTNVKSIHDKEKVILTVSKWLGRTENVLISRSSFEFRDDVVVKMYCDVKTSQQSNFTFYEEKGKKFLSKHTKPNWGIGDFILYELFENDEEVLHLNVIMKRVNERYPKATRAFVQSYLQNERFGCKKIGSGSTIQFKKPHLLNAESNKEMVS